MERKLVKCLINHGRGCVWGTCCTSCSGQRLRSFSSNTNSHCECPVHATLRFLTLSSTRVDISIDPFTGRNPSYCFVDFDNQAEADRARETLRGKQLRGRPIKVNVNTRKRQSEFVIANGERIIVSPQLQTRASMSSIAGIETTRLRTGLPQQTRAVASALVAYPGYHTKRPLTRGYEIFSLGSTSKPSASSSHPMYPDGLTQALITTALSIYRVRQRQRMQCGH